MSEKHWDDIFAGKADPELGWYEREASQTWKFLAMVPNLGDATVFLPGAGTSVLADELLPRCAHLVLNDISGAALAKLRARIGGSGKVTVLHADISAAPGAGFPEADVWVDRAVLHFLLEEPQIAGYFENLKKTLRPGGHALLAEFAPEGAPKCAGLEVHRYSVEEMARRLGPGFSLVASEPHTFFNPWGEPRPYIYALFRRG